MQDLRENFLLVLFLIWRHLDLPDPTPIQRDMAHYLQYGPKRRMVMAFRGVGKSWITAAFVIWYLLRNPSANVIVVSANKDRAKKFTTFVLRLIEEIPELRELRPRDNQRSSTEGFDVGTAPAAQTPSCVSVGITGNMTGDRADLVVFDDIEIPKNSETVHQREKVSEASKEASALLKPGGQILYLGTPQVEDSTYMGLLDRGFECRIWPILYPTAEQISSYEGRIAPMIEEQARENPDLVGKSTEPSRFTMDDIEERRLDYGEKGFALQFMLDTSLADVDKYPLKQKDLVVFPLDLNKAPTSLVYAPTAENEINTVRNVGLRADRIYRARQIDQQAYDDYQVKMMTIDPSGRGSDETGYAVGAGLDGMAYLLDVGGVKGVEENDLRELVEIAQKHQVDIIACEPNYGGGIFTSMMQMALQKFGYECSAVDAEWARGRKETRVIEAIRPAIGAHKVVVNEELFDKDFYSVSHLPENEARHYRFFYQLTHLTDQPGSLMHDDRVEAVAMLLTELKRQITTDIGTLKENRRRAALDQTINEMQARLSGRPLQRTNIAPRV